MSQASAYMAMRGLTRDGSVTDQRLKPGTTRRVASYARPYKKAIIGFQLLAVLDSALTVAVPLILKSIVDDGVTPHRTDVVVILALVVAGIAVVDAAVSLVQRWFSARVGEGLIYDLRTEVFVHVQRQPIAFFTRTQTGSLVSRINSDVMGAQQAFTSTLSGLVSNLVSLVLVAGAMFVLSWPITLASLLLVPVFLLPARYMGRRLAALTRQQMQLNAELGGRTTERFNVAGALLVKLFGRPADEEREYRERAAGVRDTGVRIAMNARVFYTSLVLVASLATALVYGAGGVLAAKGDLSVGTLLALAALLSRLYGPITALSNVRIDVMTAMVSFERVFEVLDLKPLVVESPDARPLPPGPVSVDLDDVHFSYPSADEVSLESLELVSAGDRKGGGEVLHGVDLHIAPGQLVALVGPSGAGKTTITGLVARLYDPTSGAVRLDGQNLRDVSLDSLRETVGVVTQDAHMFHDTIRANLAYARPEATEAEFERVLRSAQIWDLVSSLPQGLDTVVGDRGHRLSGGEKQRMAIARLLLKSPGLVVLDEATAHLDSESEVAVQRALDTALSGRTALVIAHRLSTVRGADVIAVVDDGRIVETGRHVELLARGGVYADLYTTQFASQGLRSSEDDSLTPVP
ncbi:MAG: ABC transporter ATP-binding protein/permease [Actinomycetota bacterium]|nr:ABC transporter ATP-binding protein/permease [Actinomycetota bacterium]